MVIDQYQEQLICWQPLFIPDLNYILTFS